MSSKVTKFATVAILAVATFASALATPSFAGQRNQTLPGWDHCRHGHCFKSGVIPGADGSSTGLSPSICNGELGFWTAVPMPGDKTFCVAQSTADFFHNGSPDTPTCTFAKVSYSGKVKWQKTVLGTCPQHHHYQMN